MCGFNSHHQQKKTLQQIWLATFLLQRIHHPLYHIKISFSGVQSDIPCLFPSFNSAFGRFLWEVYRLRCLSLSLASIIPLTQDCFEFIPLINTSLSYFAVDDTFLLSWAQQGWLVEFLNASKAISSILAYGSKGWTHILPELCLPSLTGVTFLGKPTGMPSVIGILAEFCDRHRNLRRIDCGPYQFRISLISSLLDKPLVCQYRLPQLQVLRAMVSQLMCFCFCLCNLEVIDIQLAERDSASLSYELYSNFGIRSLFGCLCKCSSIRELVIPVNLPKFKRGVLSRR